MYPLAKQVMIFCPIIGYVSQYKITKNSNSVGNFSTDVCAILLTSNILRLFYWYSDRFSMALLFQAVVMIVMQLLLLHLCIRVRNQEGYNVKQKSKLRSFFAFWRWQNFDSYALFLASYSFIMGMVTILFVDVLHSVMYGQVIGIISLATEATLAFPQMIKNCKAKSVEGLSFVLIMTWFGGDFLKTVYFIIYKQPRQFILCGAIQLSVDLIILIQLVVYRKRDDILHEEEVDAVASSPYINKTQNRQLQ